MVYIFTGIQVLVNTHTSDANERGALMKRPENVMTDGIDVGSKQSLLFMPAFMQSATVLKQ